MKKIQWMFAILSLTGFLFASDPRIEQGKIFAKAGEYDKAIAEFRAVLADSPNNALAAEAYFAAAEVYVKKTDYGRAMANYRLAYQKQPTMSAAYEGVAGIYELLGDKAAAEAERAKDPKNKVIEAPTIETPAEEPVVEAPKIEEPKEEKVVSAKAVTEEKPKEEKIESKPTIKEPAKVEEQQVKETGFTYDGPSFTKGRQLFESKKYAEAAGLWREVLRQQPGNPGAYYFAGAGRYELGELDKAEFNLKRAFDYPELGYNAHYYLSLIYKKQGKKSAEIEQLKEYIRLTPNASAKEKAKVRLDELEGKSIAKTEVKAEEKQTVKEPEKVAEPVVEAVKAETPKEEKVLTESVEKVEVVKEQKAKEEVAELPLSIESANALFKQKKLSEALSFYKELLEKGLQDEDRAFVLLQMGNIYRERRDFRLAVSKYREIVESFSESFWAAEAERAWKDAVWLETHISEIPRK